MKRVAVAVLLLAVVGVAACGDDQPAPQSRRAAILTAFLSPGPVVVSRESIEWPTRDNVLGDAWTRLHAAWPDLERSTFDDLVVTGSSTLDLASFVPPSAKVRFATVEEEDRVAGGREGREQDGEATRVVRLCVPGIGDGGRQALIYYESSRGILQSSGHFDLWVKADGRWKPLRTMTYWWS